MNYPGSFILNEVGTNKELATIYGVSERTIYRWKKKARIETGEKVKKPRRPRLSTLQNFKGTRKQLARKYGVSERTAYRWLQNAKQQGADIPSRKKSVMYPGGEILNEKATNRELAEKYDVSTRTIIRWKNRAKNEKENLFGKQPAGDDFISEMQESVFNDPNFDVNNFVDDIFGETPQVEFDVDQFNDSEMWEVPEPVELSPTTIENIENISNMLVEFELIDADSKFFQIPDEMKSMFMYEYIQFQYTENPYQFNQSPDPEGPSLNDPEKIANINIWGDEFEMWLNMKFEVEGL